MATIRKRRSRWQVQIRRQGFPPLARSFLLRVDAEVWGRQQEVALERGDIVNVRRELRALSLGQLLTRYVAEVTCRKRGAASERARIGVILRHPLSYLSLDQVTPAAIASFRDDRLQAVQGASVRRELGIIQHCLELARKSWGVQISTNPATQVTKPPSGRPRKRRVEPHELPILDVALRQCRNPLIREVFLFALATGMRRGEVLSLVWPNVNLANGTAHLPLTKNGETRTVPLSPSALEVLTIRQKATQQPSDDRLDLSEGLSGAVFPISANAFRLAWERVKRRAKIEDLRFHDLRHEAISRFFELGLSIPEVSLISGHKDSRMLFRYTHLRPEAVAKKLASLPQR